MRIVANTVDLRAATGMIVGPNESLKEIFPEGSDSAAWKKAMEQTRLKSDVGDIEARCVRLSVNGWRVPELMPRLRKYSIVQVHRRPCDIQ